MSERSASQIVSPAEQLTAALLQFVEAKLAERFDAIEIKPRDPREIISTKVYRYEEAASACQMSRKTLERHVGDGRLKIHYKGGIPYFLGRDLLAWLDEEN